MTNTLILNVPPAGVTCLRTRSENNVAERAPICLTWHSRVFPFVIPVSSSCAERARQALAVRCIWLPALRTTGSCCEFHFMKSYRLTLMLLKHCRSKFWSLLRPNAGWKVHPIFLLEQHLPSVLATLQQPYAGAERLVWHGQGKTPSQGPVSLWPWFLRWVQGMKGRKESWECFCTPSAFAIYLLEGKTSSGHREYKVVKSRFQCFKC